MAAGGVYGGAKALAKGESASKVALATIGGAASLGTNIAVDAFTSKAHAESMTEAMTRVGQKFAKGDPAFAEQYRLAAENDRKQMAAAKNKQQKDAAERRALSNEYLYKQVTGKHIGPTTPDDPVAAANAEKAAKAAQPEGPKKGLFQRAKDFVLGEGEKSEDAFTKERRQLEDSAKETRRRMDVEFAGGGSGQKGVGPNYRKLSEELEKTEKRLGEITKAQAAKEEEEIKAYRQMGAAVVGAAVGYGLGKYTEKVASAAAEVAGKGVSKLAATAVQMVNKSPKGVIAGTVHGDKAIAAVTAAKEAMGKRVVDAAATFGIPALNIAHGVGANIYAAMNPNDPAAQFYRLEGTAAIVAGVVGGKSALSAFAMRPKVSPDLVGKLNAAANRIARETRTKGSAGVAQAVAATRVAEARSKLEGAKAGVNVASIRGEGRVAAAKISSDVGAVRAGSRLAVEKTRGATAVTRAQIAGKAQNARAIDKANVDIKYKNVWQDRRGRTYHRKDLSVRTRDGKVAPREQPRGVRSDARRAIANDKTITMQKNIMGSYEMAMKGK
jgi:hypothetical protein